MGVVSTGWGGANLQESKRWSNSSEPINEADPDEGDGQLPVLIGTQTSSLRKSITFILAGLRSPAGGAAQKHQSELRDKKKEASALESLRFN